jgi:hypothetical protein
MPWLGLRSECPPIDPLVRGWHPPGRRSLSVRSSGKLERRQIAVSSSCLPRNTVVEGRPQPLQA